MFEGNKKWIIIGLGAVAVVGVILFVFHGAGSSASSTTAAGAAAPAGSLQDTAVGQDLASLNNNSSTMWEQVLQAIHNLPQPTNTVTTPTTPVADYTDVVAQLPQSPSPGGFQNGFQLPNGNFVDLGPAHLHNVDANTVFAWAQANPDKLAAIEKH